MGVARAARVDRVRLAEQEENVVGIVDVEVERCPAAAQLIDENPALPGPDRQRADAA